jgi:hypothetical protein
VEAYRLWWLQTSDEPLCYQFDPSLLLDHLDCHIPCYGHLCNDNYVPPQNTQFQPPDWFNEAEYEKYYFNPNNHYVSYHGRHLEEVSGNVSACLVLLASSLEWHINLIQRALP